eukprot:CAMPEP_0113883438 /NCGR_PEP_ID=MMETSP0780_2-20120614/9600_1 /TAXON_ID=652834 /ORGANISM="Palpitomonas bilix" /LENGTH=163 /DNA_ID=CAMNT_0000870743 /DNA_START=258 /DNA_END=746 /DNA_ORIENTATION=- /assembly_acc=CAM_ASM_000599
MTSAKRGWLERLVFDTFNEAEKRGCVRYSVSLSPTHLRHVRTSDEGGTRVYPIQLVEERATAKRRAAKVEDETTLPPFDPSKFHFLKVKEEEVMFEYEADGDKHAVIVNASPVCRSHCLIVPFRSHLLPQVLTRGAVSVGLRFASDMHSGGGVVGFNSIGAFA